MNKEDNNFHKSNIKKKRINPNGVPFKMPVKGILYEKTLRLFHESIKLFSLTESVYYTQLNELNESSLILYNSCDLYFETINLNNRNIEENKFEYFFSEFNLSIHKLLENFFLNKYKIKDKRQIISIFLKELSSFNNYVKKNIDKLLKEKEEENTEQDNKYIKKINNAYGHLNDFLIGNENKFNYKQMSRLLSFSNIDGIILKMTIFFSDKRFPNYLNFELLEKSLSIISLFLFTKNGIKFLITGKSLSRLNKLFHRYSFNSYNKEIDKEKIKMTSHILQFLHLFFKGVKKNNINLTGHKVLIRIKKNFLNHLNLFFKLIKTDLEREKNNTLIKTRKSEQNEESININEKIDCSTFDFDSFFSDEFKYQLNTILKIFSDLYPYFQNVDFKNLLKKIIILFLHSDFNFCDINIFYPFYYEKYDEISDINSNNEENINQQNRLILNENLFSENKRISTKRNNSDLSNDFKTNKIDVKLIFSFFELISKSKIYMLEKDYNLLKPLLIFFDFEDNDEKALLRLFKCEKLKIRERIILLNLMYKMLFMEKMTEEQNFIYMNKQITSNEYLRYLIETNNTKDFPSIYKDIDDNQEYDMNIIDEKIKQIHRIELLIKIYIYELEFYPLSLIEYSQTQIKLYSKELLKGIKFISDFFHLEKNLWNKPFLSFYSLSLEFLPKTEYFIHIFNSEKFHLRKMGYLGKGTNQKIINYLKEPNFNVFNRDEVYKYLSNEIDKIFKKTKINNNISFSYFLQIYDSTQERDFNPYSLQEIKDYEFFYEEEQIKQDIDITNNIYLKKISEIKKNYEEGFMDIHQTNFFDVVQSVPNESINYRRDIINYFKSYLNSGVQNDIFESLLCIITRNIFYDINLMQQNLKIVLDDTFFSNFNFLIQKNIYRNFILTKNIYETDKLIVLANKTKLILQFLQLLGEDYCTDFHDKIFLSREPDNKNKVSIFENVIISLKQTLILIFQNNNIEVELPQDKLIVLMSNLIDFIIEFIVTKQKFFPIIEKNISLLFFDEKKLIGEIMCKENNNKLKTRSEIISFCKIKLIKLITTYIQNGKKYNTIHKLEEADITPMNLFKEILYYFHLLINYSFEIIPNRMNKLNSIKNDEDFIKELIELYIFEPLFRETLELTICFNLYIMIKLFEKQYYKKDLHKHFNKINLSHHKVDLEDDNEDNWNINSRFGYRIYKFFEELILTVEVKTDNSIETNEEIPNDDILDTIKIKNQNEKYFSNKELIIFVKPYLTYFLSQQTIKSFINNVNRDSATTKYIGLVSSCDEFLFEMITNKNLTYEKKLNKFLSQLDYTIFEWINFILIVMININLIIRHYQKTSLSDEEYNKQDNNKYQYDKRDLFLPIFQIIFIFLILFIWFKFKFYLYYEKNILKDNNKTFVYRKKNDKRQNKIPKIILNFFSEPETKVSEVIKELNKSFSLINKISIGIFDSILFNREISVIIYSAISLVIFFLTLNIMFLVIPILFVANLSNTLFAIFKAIKLRGKQLGIVLLFTYLIVYLFSWFSFYYFQDDFVYNDVLNINTGEEIYESFCYSSIQCWLIVVDFGIRSGGGIADALHKSSFKTNQKYYFARFIFDMTFHLIVVLILLNIFLGIIVDAFGELRNKNWQIEKDKNTICFICQLSSDKCLSRNINIEKHIKETHNLWNYVYFLTYLELGNPNDFTRVEGYVWNKLGNQDYSWLPLESNLD